MSSGSREIVYVDVYRFAMYVYVYVSYPCTYSYTFPFTTPLA